MNLMYSVLFCVMIGSISLCGITVSDVEKVNAHTFFGVWSKFLDHLLEARQYPLSPENDAIYKAFVNKGTSLDIEKITGNKNALEDLQKQVDLLGQRINNEKSFFDDWLRFINQVTEAKQYPISAENEAAYTTLMQRGKALNIQQASLAGLQKKMQDLKDTLRKEAAPINETAPKEAEPQDKTVIEEKKE